ncbi:MAG: aminotransferase class V-fold PLP-dependent enzyme, partial [Acidobacteriota bacterium]
MIYFDNNATTRVAPAVTDAMMPFLLSEYGNPSSAHSAGLAAKAAVDAARDAVAGLLGCASSNE